MFLRAFRCAVAASLFWQSAVLAQRPGIESLAEPAVPSDPLELVTGDAQPVQDAEQRAAAIHLLTNAHALSNVRAYAYDLKTTFNAYGASEGAWSLEDTSPGRETYRWSAQGPSYAAVNLRTNQLVYSDQPSGAIPLRLAQARTAIFFVYGQVGPRASVRTASGSLNGTEVSCVLVALQAREKLGAGPRRWEETEYCVDPKSGLLMTYSPVPGMYVTYDYSNALHFYDKIIPDKFTITQAGQTIIEATTQSVTGTAKLDRALFQPGNLQQVGAGPLMSPPWRVRSRELQRGVTANSALQVVEVDGLVTPQGQLTDLQVLASSNPGLNQAALERAAKWDDRHSQEDAQAGAAPQSHEVLFTFEFVQ